MPADSLANHLRATADGSLRSIVRYDGDDYAILYQREDLASELTDAEFEEVAKNLVLKGFDDPLEQPEFARFGHLDATVRWFHDVVVIQVPFDEWSGVISSFDRGSVSDTGALVEQLLEFVEENFADHADPNESADELADEFDQF